MFFFGSLFNWVYAQGCGGLPGYIDTKKSNVPEDIFEHWGQLEGDLQPPQQTSSPPTRVDCIQNTNWEQVLDSSNPTASLGVA